MQIQPCLETPRQAVKFVTPFQIEILLTLPDIYNLHSGTDFLHNESILTLIGTTPTPSRSLDQRHQIPFSVDIYTARLNYCNALYSFEENKVRRGRLEQTYATY